MKEKGIGAWRLDLREIGELEIPRGTHTLAVEGGNLYISEAHLRRRRWRSRDGASACISGMRYGEKMEDITGWRSWG